MTISFIGIASFLLGIVGFVTGPAFSVWAFLVSLLFGAAAAVILDSFGSATLLPAHVMLGFLALGVLLRPNDFARGLATLRPCRAGFWLLATVTWGAMTAFFMPRLFAGATEVFTVARGDGGPGLMRVPLGPVSGNVTQMFYIIGDLVCFLACASIASRRTGLQTLRNAMLFCAFLNLVFAVLDYATFATGAADLLAFMRNATYRMLDETEIVGFKRLVGSFPEASTFAYATLGLFAFTGRLALANVTLAVTAPLAALSAITLMLSTSTTAYAGLTICIIALYLETIVRLFSRGVARSSAVFICLAPVVFAVLVLAALHYEPVRATAQDLLDKTVFQKATSSSAVERVLWNTQALVNFQDTFFLGAGVGSVRASSFLAAVPASIGIPGIIAYGAFLFNVLLTPFGDGLSPEEGAIRAAARFACFAQLLAGVFAGTFIDLGLPFFVFAAMATGRPAQVAARDEIAEPSRRAALA